MNEREIDRVASLLKRQGIASSFLDAKKLAENIVATKRVELDLPTEGRKRPVDSLEYPERVDVLEQRKEEPKQETTVNAEKISTGVSSEEKSGKKHEITLSELMADMETAEKKEQDKQIPSEPEFKISEARFDEIDSLDPSETEEAKEKKEEEE